MRLFSDVVKGKVDKLSSDFKVAPISFTDTTNKLETFNDREKRENNIIIYNLPESDSHKIAANYLEDRVNNKKMLEDKKKEIGAKDNVANWSFRLKGKPGDFHLYLERLVDSPDIIALNEVNPKNFSSCRVLSKVNLDGYSVLTSGFAEVNRKDLLLFYKKSLVVYEVVTNSTFKEFISPSSNDKNNSKLLSLIAEGLAMTRDFMIVTAAATTSYFNNSSNSIVSWFQLFQQLQLSSVRVTTTSATTTLIQQRRGQCQGNDHLSYNNSYPATSWRQLFQQQHSHNNVTVYTVVIKHQCFDKFYKIINSTYSWYYPASNITLRSSDPSFISPFIKFLLRQKNKLMRLGFTVKAAAITKYISKLIINFNSKTFTNRVVEQLKLVTPYVVPAAGVLSASGSLVNLGTFYNVDAPHGQCQERYNKIQNRDVDDEKDDEVCEFNNCKIDGSVITNKIQNRDVDDEKDDEVCEFNNCKLDGSVITNKIQNRDVDDEKDDEVCEVNNCKIDGSIITNKIQNRDVDDEKDDEVCEFNNCKLDGSVITNKIQNRDVDDEKDDEVCEFNNCKLDGSVITNKIQNRDVDDEKDGEVCEVNNCKIDGSIITNKIQNRDVDDEKDDEVCEFNNCKIDDSVVVDGVPNRDVDEEKDDEGSEKSCKVMIKDIGRADISQEKKDSAVNKINKYKFELGEVGSSGIGLVDRSNVVGRDVNYVVRVAEMTIDGVDETNKVLTKSREDVRESPRNLDGIGNSEKQKVVEHLDDVDEEETDGQFNRGKKKKADEHKLDLDEAEEHVDDDVGGRMCD
ncbi:hypothetical protein HELRODRAFT_166730 [Helobdella robusta]|uniref:Uncharacterized protein n=1 Tax=Helobdella robusta TaxID=6412 RepID=T1EYF9_HELRO|nr:hypothetical protein HELRODRAFT_166730 [Helobdella robusta]ESO11713.1 hypothetical protein HELRODRAFT_166730 [Helobdella robusta]